MRLPKKIRAIAIKLQWLSILGISRRHECDEIKRDATEAVKFYMSRESARDVYQGSWEDADPNYAEIMTSYEIFCDRNDETNVR
nr:hypothetical protein CFP56_62888 [Quercus suber]